MAGRRFGVVDAKKIKSDIIENKGVELPLSAYDKTVAPSLSNDSTQGYTFGSVWVDVVGKQAYTCVDPSVGAALWSAGGSGASGGFDVWQQTVLDVIDDPIAGVEGARYLIGTAPSGIWSAYADHIAEYLAGQWYYTEPETGMHLPVSSMDGGVYVYGGISWDFKKWELTTASGFLNKDIDGDISLLNLNEKNILVGNLANEVESYDTALVSSDIEVTASGISIKGSVVEDSMLVEDYIQTSEYDSTTLNWDGSELSVKSTGIDHDQLINTHNLTTDVYLPSVSGYVAEEHIRWDETGIEDIHDDRITSSSITQHESSINITNLSGYEPGDFTDWAVSGPEKIHDDRIESSSITQHEADIDHDQLTNTHNLTSDIDHDQTTNYEADEHIAHSSVEISSASGGGLSGSGDLTGNFDFKVDIDNTIEKVNSDYDDYILIKDSISGELRRVKIDAVTNKKVEWKGSWVTGEFYKNDMVIDGSWTMIANTTTSSRPAPQPADDPKYSLPEEPTWSTLSNTSVVQAGQTYTFTESGWLKSVRVWAPELSEDINYRCIVIDETIPADPRVRLIEEALLIEDDWATIALNSIIVPKGTVLRFMIDAINSSSDTTLSGSWDYDGRSQNGSPSSQAWNTNNQHNLLRIDNEDLDSTDRSSELLAAIPNTTIKFTQTNDTSKFVEYLVIDDPTDEGSYTAYDIVQVGLENGGPSSGTETTLDMVVPISQSTKYVESTEYWSANEPSWATIEGFLSFSGVDQSGVENNAYGIDVLFQEASVSPDWDLVANSQVSSSGGGTGTGTGSAAKLLKGGDWSWDQSSFELSFSEDAYVQFPGLQEGRNTIEQSSLSPITLSGSSDVAFVTVNENEGPNATLAVSVTGIQFIDDRVFVLARRVGDHVDVGNTLIKDSLIRELDTGMSWADPVDNSLIPDTDITYDLGSSDKRFKDLYVRDILSDSVTSALVTSETVTATSIFSASASLDYIQTDEVKFDTQTSITEDASGSMLFEDNNWGPRTLYDLDTAGFNNVKIYKDIKVPGAGVTTVTFGNITFRYNDQGNAFYREGVLLTNKLAPGASWSTDSFVAIREYKEVYLGSTWINQIQINPNTSPSIATEFEAVIQIDTFDGAGLAEKYTYTAETLIDGTGSLNCSVSSTSEETFITLDWDYLTGLGVGEIQGDLAIKINGQQLALKVAGYNDLYDGFLAEEVSTNVIKLYEWTAGTTTKTAIPEETLLQVIKEDHFSSELTAIHSSLVPGASGIYDLGTPERPWREGYFTGNTIHVGEGAIRYDDTSKEIQIQNDTTLEDSWEPMTSTPVGAIIAWMGGYFTLGGSFTSVYGNTIAEANTHLNPKGWVVCNGVEHNDPKSPIFNEAGRYLPDITDDRFLMGSTSAGIKGGSNTLLDHTHTHSVAATQAQHRHYHDHASATSGSDGYHRHDNGVYTNGYPNYDNQKYSSYLVTRNNANTSWISGSYYQGGYTDYAAAHTHTVDIPGIYSDYQTPVITVTGTVGTGSASSSTENRPKYISCFYILKVR